MRKCTVFEVAKWFLCKENNMKLMRLMGLCYYAMAWYYTLYDDLLFKESFEAWDYGPVCPDLWRMFDGEKNCGTVLIDIEDFKDVKGIDGAEEIDLLERVWETYGDLSDTALQVLVQSEPPWKIAQIWNGIGDNTAHETISLENIKRYYLAIYLND